MKRIIVTSSCAAVLQVEPEPKTFSELDWNEQATREVKELGRTAPGITKYRASKTLAERCRPPFTPGIPQLNTHNRSRLEIHGNEQGQAKVGSGGP